MIKRIVSILIVVLLILSFVIPVVLIDDVARAASSTELVELRQENSKTFQLENGNRQLVISMGTVHYKDNYADKSEKWKDIDLTWVGNRITKAPFELTLEGYKVTIRDKKSGEISTIELLDIGGKKPKDLKWDKGKDNKEGKAKIKDIALDTDLEIVVEYSRVRFTRILKSDKAPKEAKFKVTGNFIVRASDEDGDLPVESTLKDDILTETLKPDRAVKYPVRIDPTWQVGESSDDCTRKLSSPSSFSLTDTFQRAGGNSLTFYRYGGGMRFTNITIPKDTIIDEAYLILRASFQRGQTINTRISAEDVDDAPTFANDGDAFDDRWAARTAARIDWDITETWFADTDYNSPEIKSVVQEIVDRALWASGQAIVIFWDDFDDRTTHGTQYERLTYSYNGSTTYAPKLVIEFAVPPTVTTQAADTILNTTATGHGAITDIGIGNADRRGIVWDLAIQGAPGNVAPAASGYANDVGTNGDFGVEAFTASLTSLPPKTILYARAYAHNADGYGYGDEINFKTLGSPDVTTVTAGSVKKLSAILNGNITDVNGKNADYRGFVWDTTTRGDPGGLAPGASDYANSDNTSGSFGTGIFNHSITTTASTDYYFRAFAHNDYGWEYGDEVSFTSLSLALWFQPNAIIVGTNLPDRSGSNNGTFNWGANPADVIVAIGSMTSVDQPIPSITFLGPTTDILPDVDSSDWFIEPDISGKLLTNPLRPFVTMMSDTTNITELQAWRFLGLVFVIFVVVLTASVVRSHLLITGIMAAGVILLLVTLTIWPMWTLVFTLMAVFAGLVAERSPSL